jgi:hypothetical protein
MTSSFPSAASCLHDRDVPAKMTSSNYTTSGTLCLAVSASNRTDTDYFRGSPDRVDAGRTPKRTAVNYRT